jgi:hypothetical protein
MQRFAQRAGTLVVAVGDFHRTDRLQRSRMQQAAGKRQRDAQPGRFRLKLPRPLLLQWFVVVSGDAARRG